MIDKNDLRRVWSTSLSTWKVRVSDGPHLSYAPCMSMQRTKLEKTIWVICKLHPPCVCAVCTLFVAKCKTQYERRKRSKTNTFPLIAFYHSLNDRLLPRLRCSWRNQWLRLYPFAPHLSMQYFFVIKFKINHWATCADEENAIMTRKE